MYVNEHGETPGFKAFAIDGLFEVREAGEAGAPTAAGGEALRRAIEEVRRRVSEAIAEGANLIVLSDRNATADWAPIPSLLLTAAVHHHLVREKTRTQVGLVIETGDAREVHHMALLIGYGAAAVNPYLALDTIDDMIAEGLFEGVSPRQARRNYIKAACKGVLKVMSKMGISTVASYTGAQVFEAIGLDGALIDEYFTGTSSRIGGVGLSVLAAEVADAPPGRPTSRARPSGPTASSRWAASTSGAARASSTSSTPRPCSSCSTPRVRSATRSSRSTPPRSTTRPSSWGRCAACCG